MISTLEIHNLAIIDSLSIDFDAGLNVITGETGAGKSILIRALHLLVGKRIGTDCIRSGADSASVSAIFHVPVSHNIVGLLDELALGYEIGAPDIEIIIRRQLKQSGRSKSWVNDICVPTSTLRRIGACLFDLFSQNDGQKLLVDTNHISYLDARLDQSLLQQYQQAYRELSIAVIQLGDCVRGLEAIARNRDFLEFRLNELDSFLPSAEDYQKTESVCKAQHKNALLAEGLTEAASCLDDLQGDMHVVPALRRCAKQLVAIDKLIEFPKFDASVGKLLSCAEDVEQISFYVSQELSRLDVSSAELEQAQERFYAYHDLFRKHDVADVLQLCTAYDALKASCALFDNAECDLNRRLDSLEMSLDRAEATAKRLSAARHSAASQLQAEIDRQLDSLAMPGAMFCVQIQKVERSVDGPSVKTIVPELEGRWTKIVERASLLDENGSDVVRFYLKSNPGEPLMPLERIASGGELSRIMLALKQVLTADADTCVLVFDEIDTGISGRIADIVGRKLQQLSKSFQILCISHLAQVAVYADTHFLVHKHGVTSDSGSKKDDRTLSKIDRLDQSSSEQEIARLLSGADVSTKSLANARALIAKARRGTASSAPTQSENRH